MQPVARRIYAHRTSARKRRRQVGFEGRPCLFSVGASIILGGKGRIRSSLSLGGIRIDSYRGGINLRVIYCSYTNLPAIATRGLAIRPPAATGRLQPVAVSSNRTLERLLLRKAVLQIFRFPLLAGLNTPTASLRLAGPWPWPLQKRHPDFGSFSSGQRAPQLIVVSLQVCGISWPAEAITGCL